MNRKLASTLFVLLFSVATVFAQGSKNVAVKAFSGVAVSSGIDLYITQGTTEGLVIKGSDAALKDVEVEQNGATLTIRLKSNVSITRMFRNQSIKAYLSYKTLASISASGGSDVFTENTISTNTLTLKASGGADLKMKIACKNLTVQISGGSDADLEGKAENLNASASGGSDLNAYKLTVDYAKVSASGGSDAEVNVAKALDANASGGSDVNYKGSPSVKKNSSSSGDVNHVN